MYRKVLNIIFISKKYITLRHYLLLLANKDKDLF